MATMKPIARILIVDDEGDIVQVVEQGLRKNGFETQGFTNPHEAMEHFQHNSKDYCVVLCDVRMPKMTGFEVAREVKYLNSDVKVILMTAFEINQIEFKKLMPSTKIDDFIQKPSSVSSIIDILLKHIGQTKRLTN